MTRQEANREIAKHLKESEYQTIRTIAEEFEKLVELYPEQRAGQIICNYICPDYRRSNVSVKTRVIQRILFQYDYDHFFEESTVTLKRLTSK